MASRSTAGVPVRLLHEAEGHAITVELKSGELYRGHLDAAEDTMNMTLTGVVHTGRDGRVTKCVATRARCRGRGDRGGGGVGAAG